VFCRAACALTVVLVACAPHSSAGTVRADTADLLLRARSQSRPTLRDQELAQDLLSDWIDTHPNDVYLRHAFIRVSQGLPPADEEMSAITRLHDNYMRAKEAADLKDSGNPGGQPPPGSSAGGGSARMLPGGMKHFAVVGLFGLAVIGGGIVWLLVARRRGRGGA
jgi:hypothetical protein